MGINAKMFARRMQRSKRTGLFQPKPLAISTESLAAATQEVAYTYTLDGDGGTAPYQWSISGGSLPPGLIIHPSEGRIYGTPTTGLDATFTVKLSDGRGQVATRSYSLVVVDKPNTETASRFVLFTDAIVDESFAKVSSVTTGAYAVSRTAAINEASSLYMPESETVIVKPQAAPSGDKRDLWTTGNYWFWRLKNKFNSVTGEWYCDTSKISGTPTNQRNGGGRWLGTDAEYWGTTDKTKWFIDFSGGNKPRTLAYEDNDKTKPESGEPFVNRDPHHNEIMMAQRKDGSWLKQRNAAILRCSYGYYFSKSPLGGRNEALALKAIKIIRVWYITPATRMNPNLDYAQAIPGHYDGLGRPEGSVDLEYLPRVIDAVNLLKVSPNWTAADMQAFKAWLVAYTNWMEVPTHRTTAQVGNILTQKHLQYIAAMLFLGEQTKAYYRMKNQVFPLLETQMATTNSNDNIGTTPVGSFRLEYNRPDSWGYSTKVIKMWLELAEACEKIVPPAGQPKLDLWHYVTPTGKSLRKAIDFHYAAAMRGGSFNKSASVNKEQMVSVMRIASDVYFDPYTAKWWPEFLQPRHNAWLKGTHDRYQILDAHFNLTGRYGYRNKPAQ